MYDVCVGMVFAQYVRHFNEHSSVFLSEQVHCNFCPFRQAHKVVYFTSLHPEHACKGIVCALSLNVAFSEAAKLNGQWSMLL